MALGINNISRIGLGKLRIDFYNGNKSTLITWCSRSEIKQIKQDLKSINGRDCRIKAVYWNSKKIAA